MSGFGEVLFGRVQFGPVRFCSVNIPNYSGSVQYILGSVVHYYMDGDVGRLIYSMHKKSNSDVSGLGSARIFASPEKAQSFKFEARKLDIFA